ncbi:hypothetical protein SAMD00019534_094550 [Acytostelium subglobosum LB1]|uniref:hypothetical protein n=1 Tax=Acytostelium subglobosum LB1 TaxID=1410327 RepID=UPI000644DEF6|nr:hypothetical protein SAMD00019534_094550 [Acytostelium subglobosum LB1]GAM26280.1 hypothetical protein SAMD00019534_094550 [Acytostelium subglobosum LB1]|eukprot:XP_012750834.1 hypothetical protein SAMD00019534_094550 [Acytostelium subglobosum LB1]
MFRENTAAGAVNIGVYITPGKGASLQYRNGTNILASNGPNTVGPVAPYYVRLDKSQSQYTGYISDDGITWTIIGGPYTLGTSASSITKGLAVSSHNNAALCTAVFDNIIV